MYTHDLDPILFDLGLLTIRWYSIAYIVGILLGWYLGKKIINKKFKNEKLNFDVRQFDDLITYIVISILIGGRAGYILFYNFEYYVINPFDIIKIWEGGMSFHGSLLGIIFGTFLFSKKRKVEAFFLLDIIACVAPIGIFFGRIANFINAELVGKTTNVFWAVIFPNIDNLPRHPSQLYEAFLEGIILFLIMIYTLFKKNYKIGTCSYLFLIIYGCFRVFAEFFREPDIQIGYLYNLISMGTLLSIIMIVVGVIIFFKKRYV